MKLYMYSLGSTGFRELEPLATLLILLELQGIEIDPHLSGGLLGKKSAPIQ